MLQTIHTLERYFNCIVIVGTPMCNHWFALAVKGKGAQEAGGGALGDPVSVTDIGLSGAQSNLYL